MGFTDLVKRPTPGAAQLVASDYREGTSALRTRLAGLEPEVFWFQGRLPWTRYLRYVKGEVPSPCWGLQSQTLDGIPVWVTPNPSPANAAFSLEDLIRHFRELNEWLSREA